jgi:predicted RNase H-like HicB family nuclease
MSKAAAPPQSQSQPLAPPVTVTVRVALRAIAYPEPGGGFSVVVPALPGCITEGESIEEVQTNVVEAAELWLESMHDRMLPSLEDPR